MRERESERESEREREREGEREKERERGIFFVHKNAFKCLCVSGLYYFESFF